MKPPDDIQSLKNSTIEINDKTWPAMSVYVLPGKYSDSKKLYFNWTVESFEPRELKIRL